MNACAECTCKWLVSVLFLSKKVAILEVSNSSRRGQVDAPKNHRKYREVSVGPSDLLLLLGASK